MEKRKKLLKNNFYKYKNIKFIDLSADFRIKDKKIILKIIKKNIWQKIL